LQTDASDYGIGAILTQKTERGEKGNLLLEPNAQRRGEELLNDREGMLGNRLGDPKA